ncbi:MAG: tetratricopeptide repeat protein [Chitinophagaceae bacterium]|nr:tetratricopeptide repeat protein [Chitinophagaceae bacterium]
MIKRLIKILFTLFLFPVWLKAQKPKADSLVKLLAIEKQDSGKVKLMNELATVLTGYEPDSAVIYAEGALSLAKEINYADGQIKALSKLAYVYTTMGNYTRALELNLRKLKLTEKGKNPYDLVMALNNIGIVYNYQEEYKKALAYHYLADSVIRSNTIAEAANYYVYMNLGDVYLKLNNTDSAFSYFNQSLVVSNNLKNDDFIGNAMTGLGNVYSKRGDIAFALLNYQTAVTFLKRSNNNDVLCEATLGLAKLYKQKNNSDSAVYYATLSLEIAEQSGFLPKQLDAARFLTNHFKTTGSTDKAFYYLTQVQQLNDSINSKDKIRELQLMSTNENIRQLEIAESKRLAKKERKQQLQLLFIGIFIPGFFLLTLLLSRIRIHARVIKILGILSLLILFEYLTLFLHPSVAEFTNHTPVYEMFIFVSIAAILIPGHHRLEAWLIKKLTRKSESISIKKVKLKVKEQKDDLPRL